MVLIQQGKEIPDELLAQIEQYDREVIHAKIDKIEKRNDSLF